MTKIRILPAPSGSDALKIDVSDFDMHDPYDEILNKRLVLHLFQNYPGELNLKPETIEQTIMDLYPIETNRVRSRSIKELSLTGGYFEVKLTLDGLPMDRVSQLEIQLKETMKSLAETNASLAKTNASLAKTNAITKRMCNEQKIMINSFRNFFKLLEKQLEEIDLKD